MISAVNIYKLICRGGLVALAAFLQVQITLFSNESYQGLRVNAADLFLPFAGLVILASLLLRRSSWPQWQKPFGYWCPILLTIVMGGALVNGYRLQGEWSNWALLNKGVGWFVLMGYLALGAWFASNYMPFIRAWFIRPFILFLCVVVTSEVFVRLLIHYDFIEAFTVLDALKKSELEGFMANRNAFAFLFLSGLTLGSILMLKDVSAERIETYCFKLLWLLLPVFFVMNASRSALLIIIPLCVYLLIYNWRFFATKILPFILIGCLVIPLVNTHKIKSAFNNFQVLQEQGLDYVSGEQDENTTKENIYTGDSVRLQVIEDSLFLYKKHPITGAGLGSVYEYQKQQDDRQFVAIIDNTPLWVFVEMGPFGFLAFGCVFFSMLIALHKKSNDIDTYEKAFAHSIIFVLIGFGLFSVFHEILYSRFLWVFLGMSLAVPVINKHRSG